MSCLGPRSPPGLGGREASRSWHWLVLTLAAGMGHGWRVWSEE